MFIKFDFINISMKRKMRIMFLKTECLNKKLITKKYIYHHYFINTKFNRQIEVITVKVSGVVKGISRSIWDWLEFFLRTSGRIFNQFLVFFLISLNPMYQYTATFNHSIHEVSVCMCRSVREGYCRSAHGNVFALKSFMRTDARVLRFINECDSRASHRCVIV